MDEKSLMFTIDENGVADLYDDTWDITIHCASEEEQKAVIEKINRERWIPVEERLPEDDNFVLMSFENFTLPMIGRYEQQEDGSGVWYLGDCDDEDTCLEHDLFVNAWMKLPERYKED